MDPFVEDFSVELGSFMFGFAATWSNVACNLGITAAAHPPDTLLGFEKHPPRIQSASSVSRSATAANPT